MIRWAPSIGALLLALAFSAAMAVNVAADPTFETRLKNLEAELRCLVCQNQTLADSNASLADDLRNEVRTLATAGKSDDEIRAYLVARYGDFVLYDPPLKRTTALLWVGPFALLALGAMLWWFVLRRREQVVLPAQTAVEADAERRARVLLDAPEADADRADDGREPKVRG